MFHVGHVTGERKVQRKKTMLLSLIVGAGILPYVAARAHVDQLDEQQTDSLLSELVSAAPTVSSSAGNLRVINATTPVLMKRIEPVPELSDPDFARPWADPDEDSKKDEEPAPEPSPGEKT